MSKHTHSDLPCLRSLRDAYRWAIEEANRQKATESDVGMLMAYCCVIDELQSHFDRVGRSLSRLEKSTGGARSAPDMGQGCPALLSAVGPAPLASAGVDITHNADRFLFTPAVQKLPVLSAAQASKVRSRA